ncbi:hypothetical protein [Marinomonas mediterranea]|nr:hypothetical protein [Marinomonas mediterranea]WCN10836.1 hypothetical protein GV055_18835 [Marinomonas mediterranea]WCN14893.1 hypothetical protein GV054_18715 [Marinomonas mediterranea]WCN18937.1 hypothetical protein GV053_18770 [Marinomonas mediterranea MMB-1]
MYHLMPSFFIVLLVITLMASYQNDAGHFPIYTVMNTVLQFEESKL